MRKIGTVILIVFMFLCLPVASVAQEYTQEYFKGEINKIEEDDTQKHTSITLTDGPQKGEEIRISQPLAGSEYEQQKNTYEEGDGVIVAKIISLDRTEYFISDAYRNDAIFWIGVVYAAIIIALGKWKGVKSLIALAGSFLVLVKFMIPEILNGSNPIVITVIGAVLIMTMSLYLTHGFNKQTTVSLSGTFISLVVASILAHIMVVATKLSGLGSEEAMYLLIGETSKLNIRGLLMSGIIISALGVIDDITVTQTAIVYELKKTKPSLTVAELYKKGLSIGKEHIASVTNTLILAYAGASLPLFLLFYQNTQLPWWMVINSEYVAEEIVSTLVGSIGLALSVPITTYLASLTASKEKQIKDKN